MYEVILPYEYYNKNFIHYYIVHPINEFVILLNEEMAQYVNNFKIFNDKHEINHKFVTELNKDYDGLYNNCGFYKPFSKNDDNRIIASFDTEEEAFYFKLKFC